MAESGIKLTSEERLKHLLDRRNALDEVLEDLKAAFRNARTAKERCERQIADLDEEIILLEQGQLCLGDWTA